MKKVKVNNKKSKKMLDLASFLDKCRVEKNKDHTHTCMGKPFMGSFYIHDDEMNLFFKLYEKDYLSGKKLCLIEKHKDVGPMVIDIDLKFEPEFQKDNKGEYILDNNDNKVPKLERKYSVNLVKKIVKLYMDEIEKTFQFNQSKSNDKQEKIIALVFERPRPYFHKGEVKDGIHIMFPYIISDPSVQYLIRESVIKHASSANLFDDIPLKKTNYTDIFDRSVIEKNGWFMYGSSKPYCSTYQLTHIFDLALNKLKPTQLDYQGINNLAKFLSIRRYNKKDCTPIKSTVQEGIDKILKKQKTYTKNKLTKMGPSKTDYDITTINRLVDILSDDRADSYETWMEVGWCLHNIDPSNVELLNIWIEFSRRSSKFKEGVCENEWVRFKNEGFRLGSLHHWAKIDNYEAYMDIKREDIQYYIEKSVNSTNYDIARVLYAMYRGQFVCCSYRNNVWYEFKNHRWEEIDAGIELRKKISNELVEEYFRLESKYNNLAALDDDEIGPDNQYSDEEKESFVEKSNTLHKITLHIKTTAFKDNVLKECKELFYEKGFVDKLDSNPYLIGFNNGVFDLKNYEFRDGRPEDYVSYTTGNDYLEFDDDDPLLDKVNTFMSHVFVDSGVREYVWLLLASSLQGYNAEQKLRILTGCHAKDTLIMMADGTSKKVQDIQEGEQLMGDNSQPRNVLELVSGEDTMYRIIPIKGDPYIVNGDHIMCLKATNTICYSDSKKRNSIRLYWFEYDNNGYPKRSSKSFLYESENRQVRQKNTVYYTTKEEAISMAQKYKEYIIQQDKTIKYGDIVEIPLNKYLEIKTRIGTRNFFAYRTKVDYPQQEVKLDPYLLGYWLGDGTSSQAGITTMEEVVVDYYREKCDEYNLELVKAKTNGLATTYRIRKKNNLYGRKNYFFECLKDYKLVNNKHIPNEYKMNDKHTRMNVLAGLIDSDGHYQKAMNQYEITMKSEKLIDDIIYLVRSLGFACYKRKKSKTCCNNGKVGTYFQIQIVGDGIDEIPVLCPRKRATERRKKKNPLVYSFQVEKIGVDKYYGFKLDGNHRYLMSDFTVTHNCGANAKSTLNEIMQLAFGEYCHKFPITLLTQKRAKSNAASPEVIQGKGKRYCFFEEPDEDEKINVGLMKEFSGNDKISGRGLYKDQITFKPQWKLFLLCNEMPELPAYDKAVWRRIESIEFKSRFVYNPQKENEFPRDDELQEKMIGWKEAFMFLLIKHYLKYKKYGIKVPEEVVAFTKQYERENDQYYEFTTQYLEETNDMSDIVDMNELVEDFKMWYTDANSGNKPPIRRDIKRYFEKSLGKSNVTLTSIRGYKLKNQEHSIHKQFGEVDDDLEGGVSFFSNKKSSTSSMSSNASASASASGIESSIKKIKVKTPAN